MAFNQLAVFATFKQGWPYKITEKITTEPLEIAEELNLHFSTIGERLASEIAASDVEPGTYLTPSETSLSLKALSVNLVLLAQCCPN